MNVIPHLGTGGWETDPEKQMELLFSHILEADYSQSNIYNGNVTSFQYLIAKFQRNPSEMASQLQQALSAVYGRVFDNADVNVKAVDNNESTYQLNIVINCAVAGKTYSLATVLALKDGILSRVFAVANQ